MNGEGHLIAMTGGSGTLRAGSPYVLAAGTGGG